MANVGPQSWITSASRDQTCFTCVDARRTSGSSQESRKQVQPPPENKDGVRELVECVVFVVVLVLLLKSFVAEAFVIPTGSMAETLLGYQKNVVCPECNYEFPVNCSQEVDPQQSKHEDVTGCVCPNCRKHIVFKELGINPPWYTGDRVLVSKFLYDLDLMGMDHPNRYDVVVFKFPQAPACDYVAMNYIKRLIGLPGETIAIYYGKLYHRDDIKYDDDKSHPLEMWRSEYTHRDEAAELFMQDEAKEPRDRKFKILRRPQQDHVRTADCVRQRSPGHRSDLQNPAARQSAVASSWKSDDLPNRRFETTGGG